VVHPELECDAVLDTKVFQQKSRAKDLRPKRTFDFVALDDAILRLDGRDHADASHRLILRARLNALLHPCGALPRVLAEEAEEARLVDAANPLSRSFQKFLKLLAFEGPRV